MADPTTDQNGNRIGARAVARPDDPAAIRAALSSAAKPATPPQNNPPVSGSSSPGGGDFSAAINAAVGAAGRTLSPTRTIARGKLINGAVDNASGGTPLGDEFQ